MRDAIQLAAIIFGAFGLFIAGFMLLVLVGPYFGRFVIGLIDNLGAIQFAVALLALSIGSLALGAYMQKQD